MRRSPYVPARQPPGEKCLPPEQEREGPGGKAQQKGSCRRLALLQGMKGGWGSAGGAGGKSVCLGKPNKLAMTNSRKPKSKTKENVALVYQVARLCWKHCASP